MATTKNQIRRRQQRQRKQKRKSKLIDKAYAAPWVEWLEVNRKNRKIKHHKGGQTNG